MKELRDRELRKAIEEAREEQQRLMLATCTDRLAMRRDAGSRAEIEIHGLKEALNQKKVYTGR